MRRRFGVDQRLVHVGLPGEGLDVFVAADADEAFATFVVGVPEALHEA